MTTKESCAQVKMWAPREFVSFSSSIKSLRFVNALTPANRENGSIEPISLISQIRHDSI